MAATSIAIAVSTIFGGCCGSVATLEKLISNKPTDVKGLDLNIGTLVTFCQFLFITLLGLPRFVSFERKNKRSKLFMPQFKPLHVPLKIYLISVLLFFSSSVGNNMIFNYNITIPIHITFRCFSTVLTMITCYLINGRRYSKMQVGSTIFLTFGALIASLYRNHEFDLSDIYQLNSTNILVVKDTTFLKGMTILFISSMLSSLLSAYDERIYMIYGKHWEENMFYCHLLSLPLFIIFNHNELLKTTKALTIYSLPQYKIATIPGCNKNIYIPQSVLILVANLVTQNICITGVNVLSSHTSALTLSVVLLVRKFVSLLLSVLFFNNRLSMTSYIGIIIVFFGALLYSLGGTKGKSNNIRLNRKEVNKSKK